MCKYCILKKITINECINTFSANQDFIREQSNKTTHLISSAQWLNNT